MIEPAKISQLNEILRMTAACRVSMEANGIYQWTEAYPSKEVFENDIVRNELFVLLNDEKIVGCIVISLSMDEEYRSIKWLTDNGRNYYIHRLAVHPEFQGKGFAQRLMDFGENFARDNNSLSVRLDTFSQNKRNQKFYELRGYTKLEDIFFPKQSQHPFHCYELVL
ncbi:GNAT family N-acetyltransferase [uncultured Maribacter sp.]|uniref:GNAT family N-acetyltransferase n=1 Tax=uncultured Maribacter sp. TaxID=431308 RepID=UPI0030EC52A0|tara:strand:- start:106416 stop:106916 length:501 start_codon:yes stop_codon:yes gene_type:complete